MNKPSQGRMCKHENKRFKLFVSSVLRSNQRRFATSSVSFSRRGAEAQSFCCISCTNFSASLRLCASFYPQHFPLKTARNPIKIVQVTLISTIPVLTPIVSQADSSPLLNHEYSRPWERSHAVFPIDLPFFVHAQQGEIGSAPVSPLFNLKLRFRRVRIGTIGRYLNID